jgi:threonine/homoserine/homoserine lactone efflux protein
VTPLSPGTALRQGLVTSLANPKLAVFFVALGVRLGLERR